MHSISAMNKVEKKKNKNTSPRTAPAIGCSRLKINAHVCSLFSESWSQRKLRPSIFIQRELVQIAVFTADRNSVCLILHCTYLK